MTDPGHDYPTHLLLGAASPSHSHVPQLSPWPLQPLPQLKAFPQAPAKMVSMIHRNTKIALRPATTSLPPVTSATAKRQRHSHFKRGGV